MNHRRWLLLVVGVVSLLAVVELGLRLASLPGIVPAVRLATATPSDTPDLFPGRAIAASDRPVPWEPAAVRLPTTVTWEGREVPLAEFADATSTNAIVVISDGRMVGEWYRSGFGPETRLPSYSVAKSVVGLLVGQEIAAGTIAEQDLLVDLVPWLAGAGGDEAYAEVTVADLLDMKSGIDVGEVYENPLSPVARMYATSNLDRFLGSHRQLQTPPGGRFDYRSVDTALLGVILEEVTGVPIAALVEERLWHPLGAEFGADWSLDREDGREKAFCCLNATARDFARLGMLVLEDGSFAGSEVVPAGWIDRIADRSVDAGGGWRYSAQWWIPPSGEIVANGIHGQFIAVDRNEGTVVVRLADDRLDRDGADILNALDSLVQG